MGAAWWKENESRPKIDDFHTVRVKVNEEFGPMTHRVRWAGMNRFEIELGSPIGPVRMFTYLLIDGKAVRQD